MKKFYGMAFIAAILLVAVATSTAMVIEEVQIAQTSGATAVYAYDAETGTGTINWSAGASGLVISTGYFAQFQTVEVVATFSGVTDLSSGGVAKATFDSGTWTMRLGLGLGQGGPAVELGGGISGLYREEETTVDQLEGKAVATVDTAVFDTGYFGTLWGVQDIELQWGDGDGLAGLISSIIFPPNYGIESYGEDYASSNLTVTLIADETAIPEPATMVVLGLGSLLALRRRRV